MKNILFLLIVAVVVACSNEADVAADTTDSTGNEEVQGEAALAAFYEYMEGSDTAFSRAYFQEPSPAEPIDTMAAMPIDKKHLAPYDSFLVYNPDRSKALDPYSHSYLLSEEKGRTIIANGSPDTELALVDTKRGSRQRLFYFGPSYLFLDAKWKDGETVLIVISELIGSNKISPEIWEVNVNRLTKKVSRYPDTLAINLADYKAHQQPVGMN